MTETTRLNALKEPNPLNNSPLPLRRLFHRTPFLLVLSCVMLLAAGCKKRENVVPPAAMGPDTTSSTAVTPPTATITADPLAVDIGQTVVLNWRTTNATVVTVDGIGQVPLNGTQTVSPSNSTNFHLVAKGDGGMTEANVRVTVRVPSTATVGDTTYSKGNKISDAEFHTAVQDIFYDYDSFELRPDAQTAAAQAAAFLVQHPDVRIMIGGYADERGSAEYNLALGENRANSAKTGLINAGVSPARVRVISYGKEKQFCTESTEACWQENRRAQFTIDR
jgi:peptidoglycan-associated lipoprotein